MYIDIFITMEGLSETKMLLAANEDESALYSIFCNENANQEPCCRENFNIENYTDEGC